MTRRDHVLTYSAQSGRSSAKPLPVARGRFIELSAALNEDLPLEQRIPQALEVVREMSGFDRIVLWAKVPGTERLVYVSSSGLNKPELESLSTPPSDSTAQGRRTRQGVPYWGLG